MSSPFPSFPPGLRQLVQSLAWDSPLYDPRKAYVCALLSEAAYWRIPDYEIGGRGQIKVVPSDAFQALSVRPQDGIDALARLGEEAGLESRTSIETRDAIAQVWKGPKVYFVAIRGTRFLHDWITNLRCSRRQVAPGLRLHRGFVAAISATLPELTAALAPAMTSEQPIYATGHSLGGAMASILHTSILFSGQYPWLHFPRYQPYHRHPVTHSAYTFGMPRFGNERSALHLRAPFALIDSIDLVPRLPPSVLGYADTPYRYAPDGGPYLGRRAGIFVSFISWMADLLSRRGVKAHKVERYRRAIQTTALP